MATSVTVANGVGGRNNACLSLLASTAIKANTALVYDIENMGGAGVQVILDVSVKTVSPTNLTLKIEGVDANGIVYALLTGAAVTTVSTVVYTVALGVTVASNLAVSNFIPRKFKITLTPTGADGSNFFTASLGMNVLR